VALRRQPVPPQSAICAGCANATESNIEALTEMQNARIECQACGRVLSEEQRHCPSCGSKKRNYHVEAKVAIRLLPSVEIKLKDEKGFLKSESKSRNKTSGRTKRRTQETISIDRTNPEFTKKFHHVEEINEDNQPEVVHHEETIYPAKRRPNIHRP